jgi:transcriptional regulator with XRE-family HTH domain
MTHFQELFIRNLRFFRGKRGISQLAFSEQINISPNYLNAVENGKNFPSPEVIQVIADTLGILPYQLFLEEPLDFENKKLDRQGILVQELIQIRQNLLKEIDDFIKKCDRNK